MATKRYSAQDFQSIPVIGFTLEGLASDPSSPTASRLYQNTVTGKIRYWNNITSAWQDLDNIPAASVIVDSMVSASAAIAESKLNLATDAAAGTGSRRTLGTGATQAFPGTGRLDQLAVPTANVSMNSHKITSLATPTTTGDAATFDWVNSAIALAVSGQDWKAEVAAATTAALPTNTYSNGTSGVGATLTATSNAALPAQDGVTLTVGQRLLVKNQASSFQNGIYTVTQVGSGSLPYILTRDTDANTGTLLANGATVPVDGAGTTQGGTIWTMTTGGAITIGTTAIVFTQIGAAGTAYTAGTGLSLSGNQFSLSTPVSLANGGTNATSASAARTSLGITAWQKYSATLGALTGGSALNVTHSLATTEVIVQVRDASTGAVVDIDIAIVDSNTVSVTSANSVSASALKIVVLG